jgi:hypothetical protein
MVLEERGCECGSWIQLTAGLISVTGFCDDFEDYPGFISAGNLWSFKSAQPAVCFLQNIRQMIYQLR